MGNLFTTFTNCRICKNGELIEGERLVASQDDGLILESTGYIGGEIVDLDEGIIAPGFLELHTNGFEGFHFSNFESEDQYAKGLKKVAEGYAKSGITAFWATVPTVEKELYQEILPCLKPREFENGASLLGAHLEGPYLDPSKKGAHEASYFVKADLSADQVYGKLGTDSSVVKLVTLAPELSGSQGLIQNFAKNGTRVSLGHSSATYEQGLSALSSGATGLTHVMNCMNPLHHRQPGLTGLTSLPLNSSPPAPYFSILCDGIHVHPRVAALLYRANPQRAMVVSDSIELAGLPDGVYPGNRQIKSEQVKSGGKVVLKGSETLVGSCVSVDQCMRNLMEWTGCGIESAVQTVTENVADFMGLKDRGKLEEGRRADFVVLDNEGNLRESWIAGIKVWEA